MTDQQGLAERATAEELRAAASSLEQAAADALGDLADISFPLVVGGAQAFPEEAAADRAARQGFAVLEEESNRAIATLRALAAARERGIDLPPVLLAPVQPYLDAFRAAQEVAGNGGDAGQAEQAG